ncbi:hypothetical protein D3C81_1231340 [compost metagenome]
MFGPHLADPPAQGGNANQALCKPEQHAPAKQQREAQQGRIQGPGRGQRQYPTGRDAQQTVADRLLAAQRIGHTACERPAEQGSQVLQADGYPGNHRTEAQLVVYIAGQHRNRQADAEERDEGVENDREDLQGDGGIAAGGGGLLRGHGLVRGRAVGVAPSWPLREGNESRLTSYSKGNSSTVTA